MFEPPFVRSLHFYPVKSCKAVQVSVAYVGPCGLVVGGLNDRSLMLVDHQNIFVSQRQEPSLARVKVTVHAVNRPGAVGIGLSAPDLDDIACEIGNPSSASETFVLHKKEVRGRPVNSDADAWFSAYLKRPVRLVFQSAADVRYSDPLFRVRSDDAVSYADGFPYLLTTERSLAVLNAQLPAPVPMERFRPNIVIAGSGSECEYNWRHVEIADIRFELVKPCTRCVVTTIDQATGEKLSKEPLATLARTAFLATTFGEARVQGAIFGENAVPHSFGYIKLGDRLTVTERKVAHVFKNAEQ